MAALVSDSFNRADSTTTLGTTDNYNGGTAKTWTPDAYTWGISTNQAYQPTANAADSKVYVDAGASDNLTVQVDVPVLTGSAGSGLVFRMVDGNNYFRAVIAVSSNTLYLQRFTSGANTTISSKVISIVSPSTISITLSGSSITVAYNGVTQITATDSSYTTATKFGLVNYNNTQVRFDNFQVISNVTGGTGSATLQGVGTLTASGTMTQTGSASLQGVGTLSASGTVVQSGSANLQGVGTINASGTLIVSGSASLQGVGTLSATGSGTSPNPTGSASLQGVGTLSASGVMAIIGSASLQGVGTLQANGGYPISGSASLIGVGTLTASGLTIKPAEILRTVNLQGDCINAIALQGEFITSVLLIGEMINKVALEGEI